MPGAAPIFASFLEMGTDRPSRSEMAGGIAPIPSMTIRAHAQDYPGEENAFRECIRAMDAEVMAFARNPRAVSDIPFGPGMLSRSS